MGYYLEVVGRYDKARKLCEQYGGREISQPVKFSDVPKALALVCVVEGALFEAALWCHDEAAFERTLNPRDRRPKTYIVLPWAKAVENLTFDPVRDEPPHDFGVTRFLEWHERYERCE